MSTPSAVKSYLRERGRASLHELALRLDSTPEAVRPLVELWIAKGQARAVTPEDGPSCRSGSCGSCCGGTEPAVFEWLGSKAA